ncbi:hypothetical protein L7F22_042831 [Adiantum nelumboides]|nr:hypothetical protein [Adiantum nelumboides]
MAEGPEGGSPPLGALFTLACTLCLAFLVHWWWKERKQLKGPPSWPFIGATIHHILNIHRFHDYITDYSHRFGTFRVAYPSFNYLYTTNPRNVEHMLKTNFDNYGKGKFAHDVQEEVFGDGIFSVDGKEWKRQRKIASYEFASKHLKEFGELAFIENAIKLVKFLIHQCRGECTVEMQDVFLRLLFDSFCKVGFGLEMSTLQKTPPAEQLAFVNAFDYCNYMMFFRYVDPLWKFKRWLKVGKEAKLANDVATLDGIVYSFIEQRRKEVSKGDEDINRHDLLSRFLAVGEANSEQYTDRQIRDIILNFMIAGRDTTALTLSWFLYSLCENPRVQEKLVEELLQIEPEGFNARLPRGDFPSESQIHSFAKLLTYEKLSKMPYLQACLQETLRLYPPVPLDFRVAQGRDVYPDGMVVNKGDCIVVAVYSMGRMTSLWGEDAEEFKPERFVKDGICEQPSPFKLPAFWAGPRMCLGKDFAILQMKITLAILLRFFKFEIVHGHKVQYKVMLTLHMSESGLKLNVLPRA